MKKAGNFTFFKFTLFCFAVLIIAANTVFAEVVAYDPFLNANVGNGENDKVNGEYNAGSLFRDFTNGNNKDVAGGPIIGWSAANVWEGNSTGTGAYIGPTDLVGLSFGLNDTTAGNVRARGISADLSYARRLLDAYTPSDTYYISGLVRADNLAGNLDIQWMAGFTVTLSAGAFDTTDYPGVLFGFSGDGSQVDLVVRHRTTDPTGMTNSVLLADAQEGETYFIVLKIEYNADGTYEQLTAWLNPTEYNENDAIPVFTTTGALLSSQGQITYGGFWLENFDSNYQEYVQFDELRLGTQWNDAVPVPDPTEEVAFTQNFSVPGDSFMRIDQKDLGEVPWAPAFDVTPTGWKWGGFAEPVSGYRVEIDQNARGGVTFDELALKNSVDGYAYTIFSSSGLNEADSFINMTPSWAYMHFKISDIYDGNFEHPSAPELENGSGLPYPGNLYYAPVMRAIIRDANGQWFASNLFCPSTYQGTSGDLDGTITEYTLPFANVTWHKYSQAEIDNLNALAGNDEIPLNADPNVAEIAPDLTAVSGMGVYVWNSPTWSVGTIAFTEISLVGTYPPIPPAYWDMDELGDMMSEWLTNEVTWEETMDTDPAAGDDWVLRGDIPGDYIMAGGEMVILGNANGAWRLDTDPPVYSTDEITVDISMKATTTSDTSEGSRSGINLWVNYDDEDDIANLGAFNLSVVLDGASQYVEFISDWDEGVEWPPSEYTRITGDGITNFDASMLDISLAFAPTEPNAMVPDPTTFDLDYTISDQAGTTTSGTLVVGRRYNPTGEGFATIYTGGAEGVVDYFYLNGLYAPPTDRTDDDFVDYDDFRWLAERWQTERIIPWP